MILDKIIGGYQPHYRANVQIKMREVTETEILKMDNLKNSSVAGNDGFKSSMTKGIKLLIPKPLAHYLT